MLLSSFNNRDGFTLIEVILSIIIIGILGAALLPLFTSGFTNLINMRLLTESVSSASDIMEELYLIQENNNGLTENQINTFIDNYNEAEIKTIDSIDNDIKGFLITIRYTTDTESTELTSFFRKEE